MIKDAIAKLVEGRPLTDQEASFSMREIMDGDASPAQIAAFVTALRLKGETLEEVLSMSQVMREKSLHVDVEGPVIDTCGTGGDASGTFNISTTVGLVVAGSGTKVAKHGNRAASGSTGSADVLEELGVSIQLSPEDVKKCIEETGFGFMFAQIFHPAMKFAAVPRKEIGIRTIFNTLGPLMNPARANAQVFGMADPGLANLVTQFLTKQSVHHALVVHGEDGLDEISLAGKTDVWELKDGTVSTYTVMPDDFGLDVIDNLELKVKSIKESASVIKSILDGDLGPRRDVVLANASAALVAADRAKTFRDGVLIAREAIDSGQSKRVLNHLIELSQKLN